METEDNFSEQEYTAPSILPKPILEEDKQNWMRRSMISLAIYALLFYVIFDRDLAYIAALLVVLLIHELGHFFAMKAFNYSNIKLFFIPLLGAYVTGTKNTISQRQMSVVILAGPVQGLIIGFVLEIVHSSYPNPQLLMLSNTFFLLNLLNLFPFVPLDGGRLLEILFLKNNYIIRLVFTIISIIAILGLSVLSQNIFFLIIPASMIFELIMEIKNQKIREFLKTENINYTINYSDLPDTDYWTIRDAILLSFSKRYAGVPAGVYKYSIIEGGIVKHVISILKTPFIIDIKILGKIIMLLIYLFFLIGLPALFFMHYNPFK